MCIVCSYVGRYCLEDYHYLSYSWVVQVWQIHVLLVFQNCGPMFWTQLS